MSFTFIDLFAGIGGFHQAAKHFNGECVFASEIDKYAQNAYFHNYHIHPAGDITQIPEQEIPEHDFLFAGFPCQPFSIIGQQKGFSDTRGTLFFDIVRILKAKKTSYIILENVKQLSTHNKGKTLKTILRVLEGLGYKTWHKVLNAIDFGLPQKRERTIIVGTLNNQLNFEWPKKTIAMKSLSQIIESDVDKKFYASADIQNKRQQKHKSQFDLAIWHENKSGNITSYPYSCALRAGASYNYLLVNGKRRLTPRETLRLQGFSEDFKIVCSDYQTKKQTGNAVPVPMIQAVLEEVLHAKAKTERLQIKAIPTVIPTGLFPQRNHTGNMQEINL
ncbi:DNA (cytosine-5-)-methyltransferase [Desulfovibrio sp. JC010]|uniref:DNA cytosine methyltransferase n=1 Tax=Desulfovibrio sp. JC010 TaxID=2593641 RepID=UPI0013D20F53|nr:DNA (cytosine-5-)-methyltransferase [Desulfovibrio sp. JC010]